MQKMKIGNSASFWPMPVVLVGSVVEGKANFMTVAWVSAVNRNPPLLGMALGPHYTNKGIDEHKSFSVNIPDIELVEKTDYCGLLSGSKVDKSKHFEIFYGELEYAPLIKECPVNLACKIYDIIKLPSNTLFIGEIVETFTEETYIADGKPDMTKINPFILTMPDANYREIGKYIGKAWSIGKELK